MRSLILCLAFAEILVLVASSSWAENYGNNILDHISRTLSPPDDETYTFTDWEVVSECDKVCGGGVITRRRKCVDSKNEFHNVAKCTGDTLRLLLTRAMPTISQLEQKSQVSCNNHKCNVSEWSTSAECSRICGGGYTYKTRTCYDSEDQSLCNFQARTESMSCNLYDCFRVSEYNEWTDCSRKCGIGEQTRSRTCVPNFLPGTDRFEQLQEVVQGMDSNPFGQIRHYKYSSNYDEVCGELIQTRKCIVKTCPICPGEQVWHDCKPCIKVCRKSQEYDGQHIILSVLGPIFTDSSAGCDDECVPGCGCPIESPYADVDDNCYMSNIMCPGNLLGNGFGFTSLLNFFSGSNSESDSRNYPAPTTASTTTPYKAKTTCPYQAPIASKDMCVCLGIWERVRCLADDPSECNWTCMSWERGKDDEESVYCPKLMSTPQARSGDPSSCYDDLFECSVTADCGSGGFVCCSTQCGKKICVEKPTDSYQEDP